MTVEERVAFYVRAMADAAVALAEPGEDLDEERRVIAEAQEAGL